MRRSNFGAPPALRGSQNLVLEQALLLACWRGNEAEATALAAETAGQSNGPRDGFNLGSAHLAVLDLSRGRYHNAFDGLGPIVTKDRLGFGTGVLANFIEAAARSGHHAEAVAALDRFSPRATAGNSPLGLGRLAVSRALLANDVDAEAHYRHSIDLLAGANAAAMLARSHLIFGEWLRRQRRRQDARVELTVAYDMFTNMGAWGFAERTRIQLSGTGEKALRRAAKATVELSPREAQIADLVASGETNREVAARLFISPATVDYHLRKVFKKLDVSSRTQLARKIAPAGEGALDGR